MKKIFTILFLALAFGACKNTKESKSLGDQRAGESVIGMYYYFVTNQKLDSLPNYVDSESFTAQDVEALTSQIKERHDSLGPIESFKMADWKLTEHNKKEKTKDFIFDYTVEYKTKTVKERIHLDRKGKDLKISKIEFDVE
ncbi:MULTISPECIES: hypothetical protein [Myroides]|uniref:Lipoprotein n=1 Tax=Myroides albus TaxID=2562892 RepID=A0A6I3LFQ2_9FLAO|nr:MULTISPECIES: hypothetical protein [Myroides]MTG98309.1 hypothetical protein [Myroides albus]MVX37258.1 hypothetical protein [Myroides sp. LoEW2-1]UVD79619.1 hypothetical protein NWE55_16090 [Myroides albus]